MNLHASLSRLLPLPLLLLACSSSPEGQPADGGGGDDPLDLAAIDSAPPDLASPPDLALPPLGPPIDVPKGSWQWVDFPESLCEDGTATGVGVRLTGGQDLLVYLDGGGACWDNTTCLVLNTALRGPFRKAEFDALKARLGGTILDEAARNDFRDYNMVLMPYCTGDLQAGDRVATYSRPYYHKGRANVRAYLTRLAATLPAPRKLVVAGGYGALLNYDLIRRYFAGAQDAYLIDDSGPPLVGDAIPAASRASWYSAWGLADTIGPLCPGCAQDLSALVPLLSQRYGRDRLALVTSVQNKAIRSYLQVTAEQFQLSLSDLARARLDPSPNFRYFYVPGEAHPMLSRPDSFSSGGQTLPAWLKQMVSGAAEWRSVAP